MKKGVKERLKKKLPRGFIKLLLKETGVSYATLLRVLNGQTFNQKVTDAAIKLAAEHQEAIRKQEEQIKSL